MSRKRGRKPPARRGTPPALLLLALALVGGALALGVVLSRSGPAAEPEVEGEPETVEAGPSAIIVDQLSLTEPNPDFAEQATELLEEAGYRVDYRAGDAVTVDLYRRLPALGHEIIILRSHSARMEDETGQTDDVALFTGEMIDLERYGLVGVPDPIATAAAEALAHGPDGAGSDRPLYSPSLVADLIPVFYDPDSGELPFFGIRPAFFYKQLAGDFEARPLVIMMGCDGLRSETLARAFTDRGARAFVSWSEPISAPHTDRATRRLLERLLDEGEDLPDAVRATRAEIGPDPTYGGELSYFEPGATR